MSEGNDVRDFIDDLSTVLNEVKSMLIDKNRKYGNSALEPIRCFSKSNPVEQIKVRIDDKISRLKSGQSDDTEDAELDLLGYLVLLRIARNRSVNSWMNETEKLHKMHMEMTQCQQGVTLPTVIHTSSPMHSSDIYNIPSNPYSESNLELTPEAIEPDVRTEKVLRNAI